jgi:hypothetical protein
MSTLKAVNFQHPSAVDPAIVLDASGNSAFAGVPTAPTAAAGTNTTQIATTAFVQAARTSATARVDTNQTTTSTTFTDLATAGPAVTLTTGTKALVMLSARLYHSSGGSAAAMGFAVSGASTVAAVISSALIENNQSKTSYTTLVTGLTAGSNTFTAKYESQDPGTSNFQYREIFVIDMGS